MSLVSSRPLVFVSYAQEDRTRVSPLVKRLKRRPWDVWWDREARIGSRWRRVIEDRLTHAQAVVVTWTRRSVKSDWVVQEAEVGAQRAVLMPLRLDRVKPPLGLRHYQYADLVGWSGGPHAELNRLVHDIANLVAGGLEVRRWPTFEDRRNRARDGVDQTRNLMKRVRAQSRMFRDNPAAAQALGFALGEVGATIDVVQSAVDDFLAPLTSHAKVTLKRYRPMATGRLVAAVEAKRAHCTHIAQSYVAEGGLKDSLPEETDDDVVEALDQIFLELAEADYDVFDAMAAVGNGLQNESAAIVNMLLARQARPATTRLAESDKLLAPLTRQMNAARADMNRLAGELGLTA